MAEKIIVPEEIKRAEEWLLDVSFQDDADLAIMLKDIVEWFHTTHTKQAGILGKENRRFCMHECGCIHFEAE